VKRGSRFPNRDAQFGGLRRHEEKELLVNYANGEAAWSPEYQTEWLEGHEFADSALGEGSSTPRF
jgi:hypothetical protein